MLLPACPPLPLVGEDSPHTNYCYCYWHYYHHHLDHHHTCCLW